MEGITVRLASSKDKQKVFSMRDVYGQYDNLPAYYDWFLERENYFPFVAEVNEEIVGFVAVCLIDDGETLYQRGGRVCLRMEGKGLYKHLLCEVEKQLAMTPKRKAQSVANNNPKVKMSSFLRRHSHILSRDIRSFLFEPNTLLKTTKSSHTAVKFMDEKGFETFFRQLSHAQISYLFPEGRIFVDGISFRLLCSNFSIMNGPDTVYLANVSEHSGKVLGLLSACTQHPLQKIGRLCVRIDVHGTDTTSLTSHLSIHIQRAMKTSTVKTHFIIYTESKISVEDIDRSLQELGTCIEMDLASPYDEPGVIEGYTEEMVFESKQ